MCSLHLRRSLIGVVTLSVALLGAGCEEEDPSDPVASPSGTSESAPTSPSEPTTDAGPVEPTLPPDAEADTKAGAQAFVEFYWDVVNYAQSSGDTELLRNLSIESCTGCNGGIDAIERVYERGGRIIGGDNRLARTQLEPKPSGGWAVTTTVDVARQHIRGAGDLDQESRAGRLHAVLGVTFQGGAWSVTSLEV